MRVEDRARSAAPGDMRYVCDDLLQTAPRGGKWCTHETFTASPKSMSLMSQSVAQREERSTFSGLQQEKTGRVAMLEGDPSQAGTHLMSRWATPESAGQGSLRPALASFSPHIPAYRVRS